MLFTDLADAVLEPDMKPIIDELLRAKVNTPEVGEGKRIDRLNEYIDENLTALKETVDAMPQEHKADWGKLNELFLANL